MSASTTAKPSKIAEPAATAPSDPALKPSPKWEKFYQDAVKSVGRPLERGVANISWQAWEQHQASLKKS
jgi:hypothetical protein